MTPFVALFGPNFWAGRLISIVSALATAWFLGRIVGAQNGSAHTDNKQGSDWFAARITALLFLAFPYVVGWARLARIDLLALALSTAALYVIARRPQDNRALVGGAPAHCCDLHPAVLRVGSAIRGFRLDVGTRGWRARSRWRNSSRGGTNPLLILNLATGGASSSTSSRPTSTRSTSKP